MCQYSACEGMATHWHLLHWGNLALSGAGLLIIEATAVSPEGRITPWDLGLWSDETEIALRETLKVVREYSSIPLAIQLAHAGRKASTDRPWKGGAWVPPRRAVGCQSPPPRFLSPPGILLPARWTAPNWIDLSKPLWPRRKERTDWGLRSLNCIPLTDTCSMNSFRP